MSFVVPWQSHYLADHGLRRLVHPPKKLFAAYLRQGMTVLDLGCGMGVFTLALADLVGATGRVIAVDLQQKGLDLLARRAERAALGDRIRVRGCTEKDLGLADLAGEVDFALAFWMVHETPDPGRFYGQVHSALRPGGRLMVAEPIFHVRRSTWAAEVTAAQAAGFQTVAEPRVRFSRAAVLEAVPGKRLICGGEP